jgi:hypothetical protein
LVECAAGGEVVIDRVMAGVLADDEQFAVVSLGERDLKSFGLVPLFRLARGT